LWVEYVSQKKAVPNFLSLHADCIEGAKDFQRRRQFFECVVVQEQPFQASFVYVHSL